MPLDIFGIMGIGASQAQANQGDPASQGAVMSQAGGQQTAEAIATSQYYQQRYDGNPWGEYRQEVQYYYRPVRTTDPIRKVLEEFNTALANGIIQVTVTKEVFANTLAFMRSEERFRGTDGLDHEKYLTLNLSRGRITIRPEGHDAFSEIDFDKYMEDI